MNRVVIKSDLLLLAASFIWGTTFTAQTLGMRHLGAMSYNGLRFGLGTAVLMVIYGGLRWVKGRGEAHRIEGGEGLAWRELVWDGGVAGLFLFLGANFQQAGLKYTTTAQAGFITCLYIVLVPMLGLIGGRRCRLGFWAGLLITTTGLYFLSIDSTFRINRGDLLELAGAIFWALHIIWIGKVAKKADPLRIAIFQNGVCSLLSLAAGIGVLGECLSYEMIHRAAVPVLYGGVLSVGVAFTIQIISQRHSPAAHAAVIMSMEMVFAALGGWVVLGQQLSSRQWLGCGLMLAGLVSVQLVGLRGPRPDG